jgi:CTP:molybdopterin cytidylyltransferase MocA
MNLIMCMAGLYRRFREAGYDKPKFLLEWRGTTVLGAILERLLEDGHFSSVLLLGNRRDAAHRPAVEAELRRLGLPADSLVLVGDTAGQAETARLGIAELDLRRRPIDRRVVFHNIDTVLEGRDLAAVAAVLACEDGYIDTFTASSPAYSYVGLDDDGLVCDMVEKVVISSHATSGFYGFHSMDRFCRDYADCQWPPGERYISSLYRTMLDRRARIRTNLGAVGEDTIVLGTPAEYEAERVLR